MRYLTDEPVRGVPAVGVVPVLRSSPGGNRAALATAALVAAGPGRGHGGEHLAGRPGARGPSAASRATRAGPSRKARRSRRGLGQAEDLGRAGPPAAGPAQRRAGHPPDGRRRPGRRRSPGSSRPSGSTADDPRGAEAHRLRLGMLLAQCPKPRTDLVPQPDGGGTPSSARTAARSLLAAREARRRSATSTRGAVIGPPLQHFEGECRGDALQPRRPAGGDSLAEISTAGLGRRRRAGGDAAPGCLVSLHRRSQLIFSPDGQLLLIQDEKAFGSGMPRPASR